MQEIDAKRVHSGLPVFDFYPVNQGLDPPQEGSPAFTTYVPNYNIGDSTSEILIGLGFKTFEYGSQEPKCSYGDLISITPNSETVIGEMRGMVQTYSYNISTNTSTIVVEVYYSDMRAVTVPFENKWKIKFQLNDGANIVQNPESPHLMKLGVYGQGLSFATFRFPGYQQTEREIIIDTPEEFYETFKISVYGLIEITETVSDIHKPWLNTTVKISYPATKITATQSWTYDPDNYYAPPVYVQTVTEDEIIKEYEHTFTNFDFDPASPDFEPSEGYAPSSQRSFTPAPVDFFEGFGRSISIERTDPNTGYSRWFPSSGESVRWNLRNNSYDRITDVTPPSFFEPPTP